MFLSEVRFAGYVHRPRPRLLSPFGWYAVLAVIAIAVGAVLGLAI
jgi:hypothetical protein